MKTFLKIFFLLVPSLLVPSLLVAQTAIYRSVKPDGSALATGAGNNLRVQNDTCYFASALPNGVGVGMVLQYDGNNDAAINTSDTLAFFKKRVSSTVFLGQTAIGQRPMPTAAADQDWSIFPGSTSLQDSENFTENTNIDADLRNYDNFASRDLDANSEIWNIACYSGIDSITNTTRTFSGFTTSATEYVKVYTPTLSTEVGTTQRHPGNGKRASSSYTIVANGASSASSNITTTAAILHYRFEGLYIKTMGATAAYGIYVQDLGAGGAARISYCVFAGSDSVSAATNNHLGIYSFGSNATSTIKVWNNIFYGWETVGTTTNEGCIYTGSTSAGTFYIYNNTIADCDGGINRGGTATVVAKNNVCQTDNDWTGTFNAASDFNVSLQADAPGASSQQSTTITFNGVATRDYRLTVANAGTDLSGDAGLAFTDDCEGQARVSWDRGADEQAAISEGSTPFRRRVIIFGDAGKLGLALCLVMLVSYKRKRKNHV